MKDGLFFTNMENVDKEEVVRTRAIVEFFTFASEYCIFIDKMEQNELSDTYAFLQKMLPVLYLKGALLPNVEVDDNSANERFVTEEEYETTRYRLAEFLGDNDFFAAVDLNGDTMDSSPISLSELLSDIYTDLKDFLLLYSKESLSAKENAVASAYYNFYDNWGMRLALALPQIHLLQSKVVLDDSANGE